MNNPKDYTDDDNAEDLRKQYSCKHISKSNTPSESVSFLGSDELQNVIGKEKKRTEKKKEKEIQPIVDHQLVQIPDQTFSCKQCEQKFKSLNELMCHVKKAHLHTFECQVCQKVFKKKYQLDMHMCVHTGIKNFQCPICYKSFTQKGSVRIHIAVHNDERNYVCDICGAAFRQKGHLTRHMNVHPEIINIVCKLCGEQFFRIDQYKEHMRRQHADVQ